MKKLLVSTSGGDCPGLNAVIRGITKAAEQAGGWEVYGSKEAFKSFPSGKLDTFQLNSKVTAGIHVKGGTILGTSNQDDPLNYPVKDGSGKTENKCDYLAEVINRDFDALISIGGDGSQRISQELFKNGVKVVGVPKTIDNDLSATDLTFGFSTAVQIATNSFDKLVTTAESHHRVLIMEVMGRDAGWIALHTAIAGGAEICLIGEIDWKLENILAKIKDRIHEGRGFVNIVIAEGAIESEIRKVTVQSEKLGEQTVKLDAGVILRMKLEELLKKVTPEGTRPPEVRTTTLGHTQRGGTPIAFDRILATSMGVKAFEMVQDSDFGSMVAYKNYELVSVPLSKAVEKMKLVTKDNYLVKVARSIGISFGD